MDKKISSILAIGIILIIAIIIGGFIWLGNNQQTNQAQPTMPAPVVQNPNISTIQSIDENWQIYKNDKLGFEINIPKKVQDGPIEEIENGDVVWIVAENGFNKKEYSKQFDNSISDFKKVRGISWAILVKTVNNDQELDKFIKERYGETCKLGEKQPSVQSGIFDVKVDTGSWDPETEDGCFLNWILAIKYSPEQHKVAAWDMGQSVNFASSEKKNEYGVDYAYDDEMEKSFKFAK